MEKKSTLFFFDDERIEKKKIKRNEVVTHFEMEK